MLLTTLDTRWWATHTFHTQSWPQDEFQLIIMQGSHKMSIMTLSLHISSPSLNHSLQVYSISYSRDIHWRGWHCFQGHPMSLELPPAQAQPWDPPGAAAPGTWQPCLCQATGPGSGLFLNSLETFSETWSKVATLLLFVALFPPSILR